MDSLHEARKRGGETTRALTEKQARNAQMVARKAQGRSYAEIAAEFGVSRQRAHEIVSRERDRKGQAA